MSTLVIRNLAAPVVIARRDPLVLRPMYGSVISGGSASYEHLQQVPSLLWTINHNFGFKPNVQTFDNAGDQIEGDVTHVTTSQLTIAFSYSTTGMAVLS